MRTYRASSFIQCRRQRCHRRNDSERSGRATDRIAILMLMVLSEEQRTGKGERDARDAMNSVNAWRKLDMISVDRHPGAHGKAFSATTYYVSTLTSNTSLAEPMLSTWYAFMTEAHRHAFASDHYNVLASCSNSGTSAISTLLDQCHKHSPPLA